VSTDAGDSSSKEWRGIHATRGMCLRLSGLELSFNDDGKIEGPPVELFVSINLFVYWFEIALEHLLGA
jgi:hypothetical protein